MSERLDPDGSAVRVSDDVVLITPGLRGTASYVTGPRPRTRGITLSGDPLEGALAGQDVEIQHTIEIADTEEAPRRGATRGLGEPEDAFELQVHPPEPGYEQLVVSQDESGLIQWHFAGPASDDGAIGPPSATRGLNEAPARTYRIPKRVVQAPSEPRTRGILTALGKKVIHVVAFKTAGLLIQKGVSAWMGHWEEKHQPYAVRTISPENYREPEAPQPDWKSISGRRSLLFIHGTHTRTHVEFTHAPHDFVKQLYDSYEGRVFALDHPSVSVDPSRNVEWLLDAIPSGVELDLDILCVSRGGLVARRLAAEQEGARAFHVGTIVFVASPNAGTPLADPERLNDFIDAYTNLFTMLPDTPITMALESIVGIAKLIAVNALKGLKGVNSMVPRGDFLQELAALHPSPDRQFALASEYEPVEPGLMAFVRDTLIDAFQKEPNDLMVPTTGVYEGSGGSPFPIATGRRLVFDRGKGVTHSGYIRDPDARAAISRWLTG